MHASCDCARRQPADTHWPVAAPPVVQNSRTPAVSDNHLSVRHSPHPLAGRRQSPTANPSCHLTALTAQLELATYDPIPGARRGEGNPNTEAREYAAFRTRIEVSWLRAHGRMVACQSGPKCVRIRAVSAVLKASGFCAGEFEFPRDPRDQRTESSSKRSWQPVIRAKAPVKQVKAKGSAAIRSAGAAGMHCVRQQQLGTLDRSGAVRWARSHVHIAFRGSQARNARILAPLGPLPALRTPCILWQRSGESGVLPNVPRTVTRCTTCG